MFYEKKYPLTQIPGEHLLLSWERGYKNTRLFRGDHELVHVNTLQQLKKGFRFKDEELGIIELKLSDKPIGVDVIVNGLHSPVNKSHPVKKVKTISTYFYMFATFAFLYVLLMYTTYYQFQLPAFVLITELPFIAMYIVCAIFAKKSQAWAIYTGFIIFSFFTLSTLLSLFLPISGIAPLFGFITLLTKTAFIILMVPYLTMAGQLAQYKQALSKNPNLLDEHL